MLRRWLSEWVDHEALQPLPAIRWHTAVPIRGKMPLLRVIALHQY
jgi:hypothetical protein